jgi:hypothetical protein
MTRLPKKVIGQWGKPQPFEVEGRGFRDEEYEEFVRVLMGTMLDQIGTGTQDNEIFLKRILDGETYCEVMGHVWWKVRWSRLFDWVRTKQPRIREDGSVEGWDPVEFMEMLYDGIDMQWLGLDSVACDLSNANRWKIERVQTSYEALVAENEKFKETHGGQQLYNNLEMLRFDTQGQHTQKDSYEEPRDTERWPLSEGYLKGDPGETPVELWVCWDNISRTTTKIANRRVELAHGLTDTPNGLDPLLGVPAIPIPGRVYGDSIFNWVGPLAAYQTRIARARGDEIMLNLWQQYLAREGVLRNTQLFWRPGGFLGIETEDPNSKIGDHVALLPRRPVFQEAYSEEGHRQQQAESTAGADAVSQGVEATSKSRDVSAAEINQRVMHTATRGQLEQLMHEVAFKKPFLQRVFDLMRMNMTEEKVMRITEDGDYQKVDLRDIQRPIDIVVGGGLLENTMATRMNELREVKEMISKPPFMEYANVEPIMVDLLKATETLGKRSKKYVKSQEEVDQKRAEDAAAQAAAAGASAPGAMPPIGGAGPEAGGPVNPEQLEGPGGSDAGGGPSGGGVVEETV